MRLFIVPALATLATVAAPALVQAQDAAAGQQVFRRCQACHTVDEGGPNKVGPNLWGFLGTEAASRDNGYRYSDALRSSGIVWDEAKLDEFLENPRKVVPRTRMGFPGLRNPDQRANVIEYLKSVTR